MLQFSTRTDIKYLNISLGYEVCTFTDMFLNLDGYINALSDY